jgi:heat shock protein HtpX
VALFAGGPALVLGAIALVVGGLVAGVVVVVASATGLVAWARLRGERRLLAAVGGRPADPVADPRLWNLIDGLSIGAGVRAPRVLVIDSPGLNALAAGMRPTRALVGVTTGLLAELDRIELEAVLAVELTEIRRQEIVPGTLLAATFGWGRRLGVSADHDARSDQAAVTLTRYPPALASALEKVDAKGAHVAGQPVSMAHLWLADPTGPATGGRPPGTRGRGRLPLPERIEALREL